jgi:hypothetical protein
VNVTTQVLVSVPRVMEVLVLEVELLVEEDIVLLVLDDVVDEVLEVVLDDVLEEAVEEVEDVLLDEVVVDEVLIVVELIVVLKVVMVLEVVFDRVLEETDDEDVEGDVVVAGALAATMASTVIRADSPHVLVGLCVQLNPPSSQFPVSVFVCTEDTISYAAAAVRYPLPFTWLIRVKPGGAVMVGFPCDPISPSIISFALPVE